jgi:hypothetical protein
MQTPETMIMAGTAIKIIIDLLPIASQYKRPLAVVFWLVRAFAFIQWPIDTIIFFGITTGASAIGINELSKKTLSS